jgi:hypothetical protein
MSRLNKAPSALPSSGNALAGRGTSQVINSALPATSRRVSNGVACDTGYKWLTSGLSRCPRSNLRSLDSPMARQAATSRKAAPAKAAAEPRASSSPSKSSKAASTKTSAAKAGAAGSKAAAAKFDSLSVEQKVAFLLAERDLLRARIAELEAKQARAADRVAWALDSLRDVLGEQA